MHLLYQPLPKNNDSYAQYKLSLSNSWAITVTYNIIYAYILYMKQCSLYSKTMLIVRDEYEYECAFVV